MPTRETRSVASDRNLTQASSSAVRVCGQTVKLNWVNPRSAGLMWSSRPLTDCRLDVSGVWTDVPDSDVEVALVNEAVALISYSMVVMASKPQMPGSSFLGELQHSGGSRDFLQVGCGFIARRCLK